MDTNYSGWMYIRKKTDVWNSSAVNLWYPKGLWCLAILQDRNIPRHCNIV